MFVGGGVQECEGRGGSKEMGTLGRRKIEQENNLRVGRDWRGRGDGLL